MPVGHFEYDIAIGNVVGDSREDNNAGYDQHNHEEYSPLARASLLTTPAGSENPEPVESTPRLATSLDLASAAISAALPLMTAGCQWDSSSRVSGTTTQRTLGNL